MFLVNDDKSKSVLCSCLRSFSFKLEEERFWLSYKKYWHCEGAGEPIKFKVSGSRAFLMYDGGTTDKHKISYSVDGGEWTRVEQTTLDAGSAALHRVFDGAECEHEIAVRCEEGVFDMKGLLVSLYATDALFWPPSEASGTAAGEPHAESSMIALVCIFRLTVAVVSVGCAIALLMLDGQSRPLCGVCRRGSATLPSVALKR